MTKLNALKVTQNGVSFYISVFASSLLKKVAFVSRREEDKKKGFQRILGVARAESIQKYLDEKKGVIPTAIILSAQENAELIFEQDKIQFNDKENSFLVLDGQHRLFGLMMSKKHYDVPVIIFNNIKTEKEVRFFIDINSNQKGVPSALLLDIKQLANSETSQEVVFRKWFDIVDKNINSPLYGKMSPSKSVKGKVTRTTFYRAVKSIINIKYIKTLSMQASGTIIVNYLKAVDIFLSKKVNIKLTNSACLTGFMDAFETVADTTLSKHNSLKFEAFQDIMGQLCDLDIDESLSSAGAANKLKQKIIECLSPVVTEDMV